MRCANCSNDCPEQNRFCNFCGTPLFTPEKKGRHWVPILIMVLLLAMGIGLFFACPYGNSTSRASFAVDGEMPWFRIEKGVLSFSESYYTGNGQLTIPSTIAGQQVLALGEGCFENCTGLTAVTLPPTLQAIGENAFRGCSALQGIDIPESVRIIGSGAFADCCALESLRLTDSTKAIGQDAFSNCETLKFVFFLGTFQDWQELYGSFINADTAIFCDDGSFYQGGNPDERS